MVVGLEAAVLVDVKKETMIYLASPYSHADEEVRKTRFEVVSKLTAELINRGHDVFCPIAYSHVLAVDFGLGGDWTFWERLDKAFIDRCDEVWVTVMDGWDRSVGVTAEIRYANDTGKPVRYIEPDDFEARNVVSQLQKTGS